MCCGNEAEDERLERDLIVQEALTWVGTPFHYGACVKGAGADCLSFIVGVFRKVDLKQIDLASVDRDLESKYKNLPKDWFNHRESAVYLTTLLHYSKEIFPTPTSPPPPGTVILVKVGRDWAHSAIVLKWPKVIGAVANFCVAIWNDINTSPHYMHREMKFLSAWK